MNILLLKLSEFKGYNVNDYEIWPNGIVNYVIDPDFLSGTLLIRKKLFIFITRLSILGKHVSIIKESMKIIEDQTRKDGFDCIKFKYRTNSEKNYLNIINDIGYYSDVGKRKKKKSQLFSLDIRSGCVVKEVVLHQLVHALMFHHEQSRPDRDEYIQTFKDNIYPSKLYAVFYKNFESLP
jgi:hypothetical protein